MVADAQERPEPGDGQDVLGAQDGEGPAGECLGEADQVLGPRGSGRSRWGCGLVLPDLVVQGARVDSVVCGRGLHQVDDLVVGQGLFVGAQG